MCQSTYLPIVRAVSLSVCLSGSLRAFVAYAAIHSCVCMLYLTGVDGAMWRGKLQSSHFFHATVDASRWKYTMLHLLSAKRGGCAVRVSRGSGSGSCTERKLPSCWCLVRYWGLVGKSRSFITCTEAQNERIHELFVSELTAWKLK